MRTVDPRLWTDPTFLTLSRDAKLLFLESATGPIGEYTIESARKCGLSESEWRTAWRELDRSGLLGSSAGTPYVIEARHVGPHSHPPVVYFVAAGDHIKIGWTADLAGRLQSLRVGNPETLVVRALIRGTMQDERRLHARFAHLRASGEWFRAEEELENYIHAIHRGEAEEVA